MGPMLRRLPPWAKCSHRCQLCGPLVKRRLAASVSWHRPWRLQGGSWAGRRQEHLDSPGQPPLTGRLCRSCSGRWALPGGGVARGGRGRAVVSLGTRAALGRQVTVPLTIGLPRPVGQIVECPRGDARSGAQTCRRWTPPTPPALLPPGPSSVAPPYFSLCSAGSRARLSVVLCLPPALLYLAGSLPGIPWGTVLGTRAPSSQTAHLPHYGRFSGEDLPIRTVGSRITLARSSVVSGPQLAPLFPAVRLWSSLGRQCSDRWRHLG